MFFYREIQNIIKSWKEKQILSGSLAIDGSDNFGWSVAMNSTGDRIVVGAYQDERSGGSVGSGLAYVFVSGTGGWTQQPVLSGSLATDANDFFGWSVAMNSAGDRVVVGARSDERISGSLSEGLAYVFVSGTGVWTEQHILSGSLATNANDEFGWSVAMNSVGDRVVVGARSDERISGSPGEGLAYVFVSGTSGWTEQHILSGSLATVADQFGISVAMNSAGDRVVVGANQDNRISGSPYEGLAYMFVSGTGGWIQQHILSGSLATNIFDQFGISVAMNSAGDRAVVGAINDQRISGSSAEGLAYMFVSGTGGWTQQQIFSGSLAVDGGDNFGISVTMNAAGDRVVVGAYNDERSGGNAGSGLSYVLVSGTGGWTQQQIFSGSLATGTTDQFGISVAMNAAGDRVVVGAYNDEISEANAGSGLAYVFNEE
jgi:SH3-like domain-containing protein